MHKHPFLTVSIALLIVLSGCLGFGGAAPEGTGDGAGDGGASGGDSAGDGASGSSGDDSSAGGGSADDSSASGFERAERFEDIRNERQMADFIDRNPYPVYRPGEYLRYEGTSNLGSESGELQPASMTIQSGEGGEWLEADIEVTLVRGDETITMTEEDAEFFFTPEFAFTANGRSWIWIYRYNVMDNVNPRLSELSVGDTWTFVTDSDEGTEVVFTVNSADTYAGIDCVNVVTEFVEPSERQTWSEACVAPDVGLPLHYVLYEGDGTVMYELELVEYRR